MVVLEFIGRSALGSTLAVFIWIICARAYARDGSVGLGRNILVSHAIALPAVSLIAAGFWYCTVYIAGAETAARLVESNVLVVAPTVTAGGLDLAACLGLCALSRRERNSNRIAR
jgi:hypothetical protein